jgi:hypothetical protein
VTSNALAREVGQEARALLDDARAYLASPEGQRFRNMVATGLIVAAPFVSRLPVFRATLLGRLVGLTGGAAVIVKVANLIRDWEPRPVQAV